MILDAVTHIDKNLQKIWDLRKLSVEVVNNTGTQQTVNILQALITPIENQYNPLNTVDTKVEAGGNRSVYSSRRDAVYSINPTTSEVEVYDNTGSLITSITLSGVPSDIAIADGNDTVFVPVTGDGIDVIDTVSNTVSSTLSPGIGTVPKCAVYNEITGDIAVGMDGSKQIITYDPSTLAVNNTYSLGSSGILLIAYHPNLNQYYFKASASEFKYFDVGTLTVVAIVTFSGTIGDIKYIPTNLNIGVAENGGGRAVHFYSQSTLFQTVTFSGSFNPRYLTYNASRDETMVNDNSTAKVAFLDQAAISAGLATDYVTTGLNNIAGDYFQTNERYIVFNQASTTINTIDRRLGIKITSDESAAQYNYLVQALLWEPIMVYYIYLHTSSQGQMKNSLPLVESDASGVVFEYSINPDNYIDKNQAQPLYSMVPMLKFIFDGNDFIENYKINAGESLRMIFYYRQYKRAYMLRPENLLQRKIFQLGQQREREKRIFGESQEIPPTREMAYLKSQQAFITKLQEPVESNQFMIVPLADGRDLIL